MTQSDQYLIGRIRKRDESAFTMLFDRHKDKVFRHLVRMIRDEAAADDLVQEVFLRLWTRAAQWQGRGTLEACLLRMATNLALNYLRSVRRRRQRLLKMGRVLAEEEDETVVPSWMMDAVALGPDAVLEITETKEHLRQLINGLPEDKREVLRLVYDAEMDARAVAETLGIPEGTVKSRLHYAVKHLASAWRKLEALEDK